MKKEFFAERITQLRLEKNISEYRLSMNLGQSSSYINMIANGKALPSKKAFLAICDYFEITAGRFFMPCLNEKTEWLLKNIQGLSDKDIDVLHHIVEAFLDQKRLIQKEDGRYRER